MHDRLMMIKLLIGKQIVAIVSTYAQQQGLAEEFYEDLMSLVSKVGENELVMIRRQECWEGY